MMVDDMLRGYLECALWNGLDWTPVDQGADFEHMGHDFYLTVIPLDENYGIEDASDEALREIANDCESFMDQAGDLLTEWPYDFEHIGHDLYLTRNGHGAGFWDRFASGSKLGHIGDALTEIAHDMGESDLYPGDDGKLYVSR